MARRKTKEPDVLPVIFDDSDTIIDADMPLPEQRDYSSGPGVSDALMASVEKTLERFDEDGTETEPDVYASDALVVAAKSGDRRQLLVAMRDRLAYMLAKTDSGRDVAAIARNLNIISKELDSYPDPEATELDPVEAMRQEVMSTQQSEA